MARRVVAKKYGGVKNSVGSTVEELCMAIAYGDLADAKKIIHSGDCDVNAPDASGNRPLHTALHYDQFDVVKTLLDICCEVNVPEEVTNLYPVHIAAHKESPDCLDILLEHNRRCGDNAENTKNTKSLQVIDLNIRDETSYNTALGLAARAGHTECALRLVEAGCELDTANASGDTPLSLALLNGHTDIVRVLLEKGASLELANRGRNQSELLFSCLYMHDDGEVLRLLLRHGQNPNVFSADGRTPLMYALTWDQHVFLDVLLAAEFRDLVQCEMVTTDSRETALFAALRTAGRTYNHKYTRELISRGARVNHTSAPGLTPLDISVASNDLRAVELLLESGARIRSAVGGARGVKPPLVVCAQHGYTNIGRLLIFYGAAVSADAYPPPGESPLLTALNYRKLDMVELLIEMGCNLCVEHWLVNYTDGLTPTHATTTDPHNCHHNNNTKLPAVLAEQPALYRRLKQLASSPPWLSQLCRTRIRQHMQRHNLPLFTILDLKQPSAFKNFLLCTTSHNLVDH